MGRDGGCTGQPGPRRACSRAGPCRGPGGRTLRPGRGRPGADARRASEVRGEGAAREGRGGVSGACVSGAWGACPQGGGGGAGRWGRPARHHVAVLYVMCDQGAKQSGLSQRVRPDGGGKGASESQRPFA